MSFDFRFKDGDKIRTRSVTRKQLPLLPAYSYTDFKSQGRTLDRAIVDLYTARGQGVYVMLSRVKTLKGFAIMRWFPSTKIFQRLSEDMRDGIISKTPAATEQIAVDQVLVGAPYSLKCRRSRFRRCSWLWKDRH